MQNDTDVADAIGFSYRGPGIVQVGSDNDNNDAFTLVTRKKKNRKHQNGRTFKERTPVEKLERSMAELRSDMAWMKKCTEIVRHAVSSMPSEMQEILCLGLGSPTDSAQARFQLCFLLELRDSILSNPVRIRAFDPLFSPEDKLLLESLGIEVLLDNKEGKHELEEGRTTRTTLAYMPHCDRDLYENFLSANWSAASLSGLVLIGNDLREYTESVPSRALGMESPCISCLAPFITSEPLPEHQAFPNAFSGTAVQHIRPASLPPIFAVSVGGDPIGCGRSNGDDDRDGDEK